MSAASRFDSLWQNPNNPRPSPVYSVSRTISTADHAVRGNIELVQMVKRGLFDQMAHALVEQHFGDVDHYAGSAYMDCIRYELSLVILTREEWRQLTRSLIDLMVENERLRLPEPKATDHA